MAELQCVQRMRPLSGAGVLARASLPRRFAFEARTSRSRSVRRRPRTMRQPPRAHPPPAHRQVRARPAAGPPGGATGGASGGGRSRRWSESSAGRIGGGETASPTPPPSSPTTGCGTTRARRRGERWRDGRGAQIAKTPCYCGARSAIDRDWRPSNQRHRRGGSGLRYVHRKRSDTMQPMAKSFLG